MRSKTCALIALSGVAALTLLPVHAIASRVAAQIQLLPSAGPPTRHVEARGRGFQSGEIVDLTFGGALVRKTSADQSGTFGTRFTVPSQELPGPHDVTATGEMSGITASAAFVVRTDWPTYQFSSNRDGTNPFENVLDPSNVSNLGVVWKESLGDVQIGSSPIVVGGVVFTNSYDGQVEAWDALTGLGIWSTVVDAGQTLSKLAAWHGLVYTSTYAAVYALDARTGIEKWSSDVYGFPLSGMLVANGVVYDVGGDYLYALDALTGVLKWQSYIGPVASAPSIADGVVYVATGMSFSSLLAIDARNGDLLWGMALGYDTSTSPAVADGIVYATSTVYTPGGTVYAVDAKSGTPIWTFQLGSYSFPSTPVVANGRVIVSAYSSTDNQLISLDAATGNVVWMVSLSGFVGNLTAPVEANGVLYFGEYDNQLLALDASSGAILWTFADATFPTSPAVADGKLYIGSFDGDVYSFGLGDDIAGSKP